MTLQKWMKKNDFNDDDVADAVGVGRSYISRIRRNLVHPSLGTALTIYQHTGGQVELTSMLPRQLQGVFKRRWRGSARI